MCSLAWKSNYWHLLSAGRTRKYKFITEVYIHPCFVVCIYMQLTLSLYCFWLKRSSLLVPSSHFLVQFLVCLTLDFTCMKQTYLQEYCVYESGFFFSCLVSNPNILFKSSRSVPFPYLQCCVIYLQHKSPLIMVYFLSWGPPIFWLIFPPICIQEHSLESCIVL